MVRRYSIGNDVDPEIYEIEIGDYVRYADYAKLEEELARVEQCYLTLRECKGERNDSETELACGSGDIVRVECKKMGELREALRECAEALGKFACPECKPKSPLCVVTGEQPCEIVTIPKKAREVLDEAS